MITFLLLFVGFVSADDLVIEKIMGNASDIQLVRPDGWKQVPAIGARAPQGSRLVTGSEASVLAKLPDGSTVFLGTESEAAFHSLTPNQLELSLEQGRARATVPKSGGRPRKFRIKTKAATMGVRGTDFTVELRDELIDVHVLDGSVEVARTGLVKPEFILEPRQALSLGTKALGSDQPRSFEPVEFLANWEKSASPVELHWWQRLWRWFTGLFAES